MSVAEARDALAQAMGIELQLESAKDFETT
jgi:hypothetical protein